MKTILVTGATRGIGRAITEKLLNEGHAVCGVYKESSKLTNLPKNTEIWFDCTKQTWQNQKTLRN